MGAQSSRSEIPLLFRGPRLRSDAPRSLAVALTTSFALHTQTPNHFADLSQFSYLGDRGPALLNVGWLDAGYDFPRGSVSQADVAALERLAVGTWQPVFCRGWHTCSLCGQKPDDEPIVRDIQGENKLLGADNLFIPAGEVMYVAPTLILHYVETHGYLPPAEFLAAVRATDPREPGYERECERLWGAECVLALRHTRHRQAPRFDAQWR